MTRLLWKLVGGLLPFVAVLGWLSAAHQTRSVVLLGAAIIWANACGFIEGHFRKVGE